MWCIAPLFSDVSHEDDLIEISARHRHLLEWDTWTQKPKAGFSETRVQLTDMRPWLTNWDPPLQGEMLIKHLEKTEKFLLAWKLKLFLPCMPLASMFPVVKISWGLSSTVIFSQYKALCWLQVDRVGQLPHHLPPPCSHRRLQSRLHVGRCQALQGLQRKSYKNWLNIKLLCFERKFINLHFSTCVGSSTSDKWTLSLHFGR